jgi:hypothetical protein
VRLTQGPTAGARAPRAGDVLRADQAPQGSAPNWGVLQDPLLVNSLFLPTPARMAALGVV